MTLITVLSIAINIIGAISVFREAARHYKLSFMDCFSEFTRQLSIGQPSGKDYTRHTEYTQGPLYWAKAHTFDIDKYLAYTGEMHRNNSKLYADIFTKMRSHKVKVFLLILFKMKFSDVINIDGFEYDPHASRFGK